MFLDIFPILRNPLAFETLITHFVHHITSHTIKSSPSKKIDVVVGLDARGFLLGPLIALRLGAAFVPVRKRGKLPGECVSASYEKEYGTVSSSLSSKNNIHDRISQDIFEMQADAIQPGQTVIVIDDLIATGMQSIAPLVTIPEYICHTYRWFCQGCRRARWQAGRQNRRIPLHH